MRITIFFIFYFSVINAQQYTISGSVIEHNNKPLSFVNVFLLKKQDSTFVSGTSTNTDGKFVLNDLQKQAYLLKFSFLGYKNYFEEVSLEGNTILKPILLKEHTEVLDEIYVDPQKPIYTKTIDGLTLQVQNTTLSAGNTWDILNRTPGIIINQNTITVQNQKASVYINNRKVSLSDEEMRNLLQNFSGNNIQTIQVITNPSSKYDAEDSVIINIITSKNLLHSYKGSVSGNFTQGFYPKYSLSTSHFYKNNWMNVFVNYSFNGRKERKNDIGEINFFDKEGKVNSVWENNFTRRTISREHILNTFIDFNLGKNTTLNFSNLISFTPKLTYDISEKTDVLSPQNKIDSLFVSTSNLEYEKSNIDFDVTLNHQFAESQSNISAAIHYTNFDKTSLQHLQTKYYLPNAPSHRTIAFSVDSNQDIHIFSGQLDFNSQLFKIPFEVGLKATSIKNGNKKDHYQIDLDSNIFISDNDNFKYQEDVFAGYLSTSKGWGKWNIKFGVRAELAQTEGNSIAVQEIFNREYVDFFPDAVVNFVPDQNNNFSISYKKSIQRPKYEQLNPFKYYINENNFISGNPFLLPGKTDRISFNYLVENTYSFEFYYRKSTNDIELLLFQNNEQRFLNAVASNLESKIGYGIDFFTSLYIRDWWYFNNYTSIFHEENSFRSLDGNQLITVGVNGFFTNIYNSLTLSAKNKIYSDVILTHVTGFVSGNYIMENYSTISVGIKKSLWNQRAMASINFNDILNSTNTKMKSQLPYQSHNYLAHQETQFVQLGFVYNFGNYRLKHNPKNQNSEERDRLGK